MRSEMETCGKKETVSKDHFSTDASLFAFEAQSSSSPCSSSREAHKTAGLKLKVFCIKRAYIVYEYSIRIIKAQRKLARWWKRRRETKHLRKGIYNVDIFWEGPPGNRVELKGGFTSVPWGELCLLSYDPFFRSYKITVPMSSGTEFKFIVNGIFRESSFYEKVVTVEGYTNNIFRVVHRLDTEYLNKFRPKKTIIPLSIRLNRKRSPLVQHLKEMDLELFGAFKLDNEADMDEMLNISIEDFDKDSSRLFFAGSALAKGTQMHLISETTLGLFESQYSKKKNSELVCRLSESVFINCKKVIEDYAPKEERKFENVSEESWNWIFSGFVYESDCNKSFEEERKRRIAVKSGIDFQEPLADPEDQHKLAVCVIEEDLLTVVRLGAIGIRLVRFDKSMAPYIHQDFEKDTKKDELGRKGKPKKKPMKYLLYQSQEGEHHTTVKSSNKPRTRKF